MVRKTTEEELKAYKDGYEDATKAIINLINDFYKDDVPTGEI